MFVFLYSFRITRNITLLNFTAIDNLQLNIIKESFLCIRRIHFAIIFFIDYCRLLLHKIA